MQRIAPYLWFDTEAAEAARLYASSFEDSEILSISTLRDTPSGNVEVVVMRIGSQLLKMMAAGPYFKINPSVSFLVACATKEEVDRLWKRLSEKGQALMELGEYPFSEHYGWIQDRFGVSWQLMYRAGQAALPKMTPTLMFVGKNAGKAEEALKYYGSIFEDSKIEDILRYGAGDEPEIGGTVKHAEFTLAGQRFAAMDSAQMHNFAFSEAMSFEISCRNQEEIDYYWQLSADPSAEQCGWLKDKYGLSWQVVPAILEHMLSDEDPHKVARVTEAFLAMKKFDLAALKAVYEH